MLQCHGQPPLYLSTTLGRAWLVGDLLHLQVCWEGWEGGCPPCCGVPCLQGKRGGEGSKMVSVVARQKEQDPEDVFLFVLTSNGLQMRQLCVVEPDKLYCECDMAREAMWPAWSGQVQDNGGSPVWLSVWVLDLSISTRTGGCVDCSYQPPRDVSQCLVWSRTGQDYHHCTPHLPLLPSLSSMMGEGEGPRSYKLITVGDRSYVYNREGVTMVELPGTEAVDNKIFSHILGAAQSDDTSLLFLSNHGAVSLPRQASHF